MAEQRNAEALEMRIAKLEQLLQGAQRQEAVNISADEMKAYQKVRDVIAADFGDFCGINDCFRCIVRCIRCFNCFVCQVCRRCDIECSCGPCGISGGGMSGSLGRFSGLGGD